MSARDVLFVYDGRRVVHLLWNLRMRPGDPRGTRAIPACNARSDRRWRQLWEVPRYDDLRACVRCRATVAGAALWLSHLDDQHEQETL